MKLSFLATFAFLTLSLNSLNVSAEQTTGVIRGSVVDESGSPISGASVQIVHIPSGSKSSTSSGSTGAFYSRGLRLGGPFRVMVTKSGDSSTQSNIFTSLGSESNIYFKLGSGDIEEIIVTAKSVDFKSLGVGPGSTFTAEDISKFASIDRDIRDISKLDPFVTVSSDGDLSFAGGMPRLVGFLIDGISASDSYGLGNNKTYPTNRMPISMDLIDQVSVKLANYDAELGEASSGNIVLTTKAGTNEFHGSVTFESSQESGDEPFGKKI